MKRSDFLKIQRTSQKSADFLCDGLFPDTSCVAVAQTVLIYMRN